MDAYLVYMFMLMRGFLLLRLLFLEDPGSKIFPAYNLFTILTMSLPGV